MLLVAVPPALSCTVNCIVFGPVQQNEAVYRTDAPSPMKSPVDAIHRYVRGWLSGSDATAVIVELAPTEKAEGSAERLWITGFRFPEGLAGSPSG